MDNKLIIYLLGFRKKFFSFINIVIVSLETISLSHIKQIKFNGY